MHTAIHTAISNCVSYTYTYTHLTPIFREYPGEPVPER